MEKSLLFRGIGRFSGLVAFSILTLPVLGQSIDKQDTIPVKPEAIYQILKPSCMPCHSNEGKDKPRNAVNFSIWEQYTSAQKLMLAGSIQNEVKKGSMPPKRFLESHADVALSESQLNLIVQWCDSLKAKPNSFINVNSFQP